MKLRDIYVTATRYYCVRCDKYTGLIKKCKVCGGDIDIRVNENVSESMKNVPKNIRLASTKSVVTSYKACITNIRKNNIGKFNVGFKSKKNPSDSIELEHTSCSISDKGFVAYSEDFSISKNKRVKKRTLKNINIEIKSNPKIVYDRVHNEYFLHIPIEAKKSSFNESGNCLSIDPGIKTFATVYDSVLGNTYKIENRKSLLNRLKKKIAEMQSYGHKTNRWNKKFNNVISDFHWRACDFLVKAKPEYIILPHFESQKMKKNSQFNFILLNTNKHYQFAEKLKWKCLKNGIKLVRIGEEYTTRTCGMCGLINNNITLCDRTFTCINIKCNMKNVDRDSHAARNILIKACC